MLMLPAYIPAAGEAVATGDLTLDLRNMSAVQLAPDGKTVRAQAGAIMGK